MRVRSAAPLLCGAAALCLIAISAPARAAQPANDDGTYGDIQTAASGEQGGRIETVVVTAEKRAENSQTVPIALTAIAGDMLDSQGIVGFQELSSRVPSLRFGAGVTGGENVITIRGLGSVNTTPGGDSPVAYSVDGVTLQRSTSIDPEYYDIDRIEVLRGPQGTLYGRNSVGGSINVVTMHPTDTLGGSIDALVGDYGAYIFRGWVNAPLVDDTGGLKIDVRLTGVISRHSPYSQNLSTAPTAVHNQNAQDLAMLRGQVYVEFNPDVNVLFSASVTDNRDPVSPTTAWWEQPTRFIQAPGGIPLGSPCDFHTAALFKARKFCHDFPENAHNRLELYAATLNWNLDFATLTSVTGYSTSDVSQTSDGDGSDLPMAFGQTWILKQHQWSEEVRLASNDDGSPLKWIAGFLYFWADNFEDFAYIDSGFNDTFPFPGVVDTFTFLSHGHSKTSSYAPFGQIDFDLGKTSLDVPLTITLGARYSDDRKYGTNFLDYRLPLICPPPGTCLLINNVPFSQTWGQWTGKAGLNYKVNDSVMAYASAARGYIAGGNIVGLTHIYGPESAWSYEAGVKSQFWDDRVQLNVAAYHEEIAHLQVFVQSSTQSGINNVNGITQVNGIETEVTAIPIDNLRLNAAVTITDATYGNYISTDTRFGGPGPGCSPIAPFLCNFRGNWLNQTPPYTVDLGAEYNFETSIGTITPRVDAFFSGRVQFLPDNFPTSTQHAYTMTNLNLTWVDKSGRYKLDAFVRNIENSTVISNDGLQSITLGQQVIEPDNFAYYAPRTFGIRFGVNL
jgi:iron complex outermembrane receptor protein